jgi:hypothetical protein
MLLASCDGHQVFEFTLYNKKVRSLVKENQSHSFFDDHWADVQKQDVKAKDETEARHKIEHRFPSHDGFVIETFVLTSI